MRKVKDVLRLRLELGLGQRQIARSCGMTLSTVHEYLERAAAAGIEWPLPEGLGDEALEAKLFGNSVVKPRAVSLRPEPEWKAIHEQLQQHRHLTLRLLWEEYREAHPEGFRYSWFCERYQQWRRQLDVVLRQQHKAGEKMFVDWAGATIRSMPPPRQKPCGGAGSELLHLCGSDSRSATASLDPGPHPRAGMVRRGAQVSSPG